MIEKKLKSINPKNNIKISSWKIPSLTDIDITIKKTAQAQTNWSEIDLVSRLDFVNKLRRTLSKRAKEFSTLIADEMGKPKNQGIGEINKCVWLCDYYLKNTEQILSDEYVETEFYESFVTYRPLGLVLGIMPWNFPFWQVFRFGLSFPFCCCR